MRKKTRRRLEFLAAFSAYFVAIWLLWPTPVIYPLKLFVVLLHEIGHGLAAIATGGSIDRIAITPDQGGVCYCMGGNALVTLSAGYLGSLAFGVAMIEAPRRGERVSAWALWFLGGLVLAIAALYVRSLFSLAVAGAAGAGLLLAAARLLRAAGHPQRRAEPPAPRLGRRDARRPDRDPHPGVGSSLDRNRRRRARVDAPARAAATVTVAPVPASISTGWGPFRGGVL
jgi:hypothetical protein